MTRTDIIEEILKYFRQTLRNHELYRNIQTEEFEKQEHNETTGVE